MKPEDWFARMRDDDRWTNHVAPVRAPRHPLLAGIAIAAVIALCVVATFAIVPALRSIRTPAPASTTNAPVSFLQANGIGSGVPHINQVNQTPVALWGPDRATISVVLFGPGGCPDTPTSLRVDGSDSMMLSVAAPAEGVACRTGTEASTITFDVPRDIDTDAAVTVSVPIPGAQPTTVLLTVTGHDAVRPCVSADFTLAASASNHRSPGNFDYWDLELTRVGDDSCVLNGAPYLTLYNATVEPIGRPSASAVLEDSGGPITEKPGDVAHVQLSVKRAEGYPAGSCEPVASTGVSVLVTGSLKLSDALRTPLVEDVCTNLDAKQLTASNYQPAPIP